MYNIHMYNIHNVYVNNTHTLYICVCPKSHNMHSPVLARSAFSDYNMKSLTYITYMYNII